MITQQVNKCIVKDSLDIRTKLNDRWTKHGISSKFIVYRASLDKKTFTESQLSRYRKHGNVKGAIQTSDVLYLCDKYHIELKLTARNKKFTKADITNA